MFAVESVCFDICEQCANYLFFRNRVVALAGQ